VELITKRLAQTREKNSKQQLRRTDRKKTFIANFPLYLVGYLTEYSKHFLIILFWKLDD